MAHPSPRQRLASLILGRNVVDFIADGRSAEKSWPTIARDLRDATDGEIDVTGEAVRQWHAFALLHVEDASA